MVHLVAIKTIATSIAVAIASVATISGVVSIIYCDDPMSRLLTCVSQRKHKSESQTLDHVNTCHTSQQTRFGCKGYILQPFDLIATFVVIVQGSKLSSGEKEAVGWIPDC